MGVREHPHIHFRYNSQITGREHPHIYIRLCTDYRS